MTTLSHTVHHRESWHFHNLPWNSWNKWENLSFAVKQSVSLVSFLWVGLLSCAADYICVRLICASRQLCAGWEMTAVKVRRGMQLSEESLLASAFCWTGLQHKFMSSCCFDPKRKLQQQLPSASPLDGFIDWHIREYLHLFHDLWLQ